MGLVASNVRGTRVLALTLTVAIRCGRDSATAAPPNTASTSPVTVVVDNTPPEGTLSSPASSLVGTVTLEGDATDSGSGVANWTPQIRPAGPSEWTNACPEQSTPTIGTTYSCTLDTTEYPSGAYEFRAAIWDRAGNIHTTSTASATIDNPDTTSDLTYLSQFGSTGEGDGQFVHPASVAVDSHGNAWVVDQGNNRVEKFNATGEYLDQLGSEGSGSGQFKEPDGIAIDAEDHIWVADAGNSRIEEFNEKGEYLKTVGSSGSGAGQFNYPEGIAIDTHGNVWVSDTYNARVEEFSEEGEYLKTVGTEGTGEEKLTEPEGLAVDSHGNLWVTEWLDSVVEYKENGEFVRRFGTEGRGNGKFERPFGVAIGPSGGVWVGDIGTDRIEEFSELGEYISQFGSGGSGEDQFSFGYPMGLAFDENGDVLIADSNNNRIEELGTPIPPSNTTPPNITGEYFVGATLNASNGTWTGSPQPSFDYQWQECVSSGEECSNIIGATSQSYTVGESTIGKEVRVLVTAVNTAGSATTESSPTDAIATPAPPSNTAVPAISGTAQDGQTLSVSTGSWTATPSPSYGYQWQSCNSEGEECNDIEGATGAYYTVGSGELQATLRVVVTATNLAGATSATSAASAEVEPGAPSELLAPIISGDPSMGETLYADAGEWGGTETSTAYQWERCNSAGGECATIAGAIEPEYKLVESDAGTTLRLRVGASDALGSVTAVSSVTEVIGEASNLTNTWAPSISGTPQSGKVLTANAGSWLGIATIGYAYQWQSCDRYGADWKTSQALPNRPTRQAQGTLATRCVSSSAPANRVERS